MIVIPSPDANVSQPLCPRCKQAVSDDTTRCDNCGEYFPATRHREGDVRGAAMCGLVRGIGLMAFAVAVFSLVALFAPPVHVMEPVGVVLGVAVAVACHRILQRLHASTYHVQ